MAEKLSVRVVLEMAERVLAPLKRIQSSSSDAANALKATRERLKELNAQQAAVGHVQKQQAEFARLNNELKIKQSLLAGMRAGGAATAAQIKREENGVRKLSDALELQRAAAGKARAALNAMGVTGNLSAAQSRLKADIDNATGAMTRQRAELQRLAQHQQRLQALNEKHAKAMMRLAKWGGAGALMQMGGQKINGAMMKPVQTFADAEEAQTQLRISFMQKDGSVVPEYQQILKKAEELGDRLPGTTADFIRMMTVLRQEGMSAKAVLGGLGDAAANLGVLLGTGPEEAATKMAKMQDSLRATEDEMGSVADLMQRAKYLGADMSFMQSAIGNAAPVMDVMKIQGAQAMQTIAPMAVMMNQAGMEDGGSVGNAVRKIYDRAMNSKKVAKANGALKAAGAGFALDFTDGRGEFGGLEKLFDQLAKLRRLSTADRGMVINALWGDDAETTRVLSKWIESNLGGYRETVQKMQAQADLQQRVNEQLGTLKNVADAAGGSFSNLLKELGGSIAPDIKAILNWLGGLAQGMRIWASENPRATRAVMLTVVALGALLTVVGTLTVGVVAVLGPMTAARYLLGKWALGLLASRAAATGAVAGMGLLYRAGFMLGRAFALLRSGASFLLVGLRALAVFLIANPIVAAFALLATAAYMVWRNWDGIKGGLLAIWEQLSAAVGVWWQSTAAGAAQLWQDLVALKDRFFSAGADLMEGLMGGITSRLAAVRDAVVGAADAVGAWFREKLGIASPSKVFMQYGGWISEGAALGIAGGQGAVRTAALAMAAAAGGAIPLAGNAAAMKFDTRPPMTLAAPGAQAGARGGATYHITVNAAPGMDERALARAVAQELDRRERQAGVRARSAMRDD